MKRYNYKYLLSNRRKYISGLLLYKNKNIVCIINNPVDYFIDGITFINAKKIKKELHDKNKLKEKVMNYKIEAYLKKEKRFKTKNFESLQNLFNYIKATGVFCELSLIKENVIYIGEVIDVKEDSIDIDFYDTRFKLLDKAFVKYKDIRTVTVSSDYADTFENIIRKE